MKLYPLSALEGQEIVRWTAGEMALSGGEPIEVRALGEATEYSPVVWYHESVPYLQLTRLDLHLADGHVFRLVAWLPDGTGHHGLYLFEPPLQPAEMASTAPSIYRTRDLKCLPLGVVHPVILRADGPNAIIELALQVGLDTVSLIAGEVYEQLDGTLRIVEADESILLQYNGAMPTQCMA